MTPKAAQIFWTIIKTPVTWKIPLQSNINSFQALQDLENSASSDAVVREKIARLPPEVSETSHLEKISSTEEGPKLLTQVTIIVDT